MPQLAGGNQLTILKCGQGFSFPFYGYLNLLKATQNWKKERSQKKDLRLNLRIELGTSSTEGSALPTALILSPQRTED